MFSFANQKCPICGKPFSENEDIVVCPECGTPHHRECWLSLGHCAMQAKHAEGYRATGTYQTEAREQAEPTEEPRQERNDATQYCIRCGQPNRADASFCNRCGAQMPNARPRYQAPQPGNPYRTASEPFAHPFDPFRAPDNREPDFEDVPAADVDKLIGKGSFYYMDVFHRIAQMHSSGRFHLSAFLLGGVWLCYRKMTKRGIIITALQGLLMAAYLITALYCSVPILNELYASVGIDISVAVPAGGFTVEQSEAFMQALSSLNASQMFCIFLPGFISVARLVLRLVVGFSANRWYYRSLLKKARAVRAQFPNSEALVNSELTRLGGVSLKAAYISGVILVVGNFILEMVL